MRTVDGYRLIRVSWCTCAGSDVHHESTCGWEIDDRVAPTGPGSVHWGSKKRSN